METALIILDIDGHRLTLPEKIEICLHLSGQVVRRRTICLRDQRVYIDFNLDKLR